MKDYRLFVLGILMSFAHICEISLCSFARIRNHSYDYVGDG
jgi:hypothetical protein